MNLLIYKIAFFVNIFSQHYCHLTPLNKLNTSFLLNYSEYSFKGHDHSSLSKTNLTNFKTKSIYDTLGKNMFIIFSPILLALGG
jgi:hypothetical protein